LIRGFDSAWNIEPLLLRRRPPSMAATMVVGPVVVDDGQSVGGQRLRSSQLSYCDFAW